MRAWRLTVGLLLSLATSVSAATHVTIHELKDGPELFYGQTVLLECFYDKESPVWVSALPEADQWIGFFVTGRPEKALTWRGEYYNLLFAPYSQRDAVRSLRAGDKITVIGEVFHYHSASVDGAGIHVQQLLQGWGSDAKVIGASSTAAVLATAVSPAPAGMTPEASHPSSPKAAAERYVVTINGKHYEGLRFGDHYNFDSIEFQVDKAQ